MLYPEDYELLCALVVHEGRIRIPIDDGTKRQARHLVELGYATTVPINVQSFALEITQQGYVAKVLADFGIWSPDFCAIEPQPSEMNDQWVIKISTVNRSPVLMDIANAIELVTRLVEVGAIGIAHRFQAEIERTRRYMNGRLCAEIQ